MLRKIRLAAALLFFTMITLLFLDFTGTVHGWFGWMAKIQFLPAVLALNVGVVIALVLLTLLLGRVYCSVINVLCCCRFMRQLLYYIKVFHVCQQLFYFFFAVKNVNIKFDIFSCFYRFAVLHNT